MIQDVSTTTKLSHLCNIITTKIQPMIETALRGDMDLEVLRHTLRKHRGATEEVMQRGGCSREMVRLVLLQKRNNDNLLKICAEVALERETQAAALRAEIHAAIDNIKPPEQSGDAA